MPNPESVEPRCDGLIVHVGVGEPDHDKALRLARRVVRRNLRGTWKVAPLGPHSRDFEVTRAGRRQAIAVGTAWNHVHKLERDRDVADAEPSFEMAGLEPDPEYIARQLTPFELVRVRGGGGKRHKPCSKAYDWTITNTRCYEAWRLPVGGGKRYGKGIWVGHPDTGYTRHPEVWMNPTGQQRLRSGYDFIDGDDDAYDPLAKGNPGHGTKTSSVIMSDIGRQAGGTPFVTGTAPESSLVAYRTIRKVVVFNFKRVAKAILAATEADNHVISMSLGGPWAGKALRRAIRYAIDRGVILLAAAGQYWPWVVYPAKHDEVIALAGSNCRDRPWPWSARGRSVDLSAPGESVWAAVTKKKRRSREFKWDRGHGTSYAVAMTAGACALWLARHDRVRLIRRYGRGNLASVFKELLTEHGVRTPPKWKTKKYGSGILDAYGLLRAKLPDTASAKGMKVGPRGGAAPTDAISELHEFFPDHGAAALRLVLATQLHVKEANLDDLLDELGDELTFHVATNMRFRYALQRRLRGQKPVSIKGNRQLVRQASRDLGQLLRI